MFRDDAKIPHSGYALNSLQLRGKGMGGAANGIGFAQLKLSKVNVVRRNFKFLHPLSTQEGPFPLGPS
jgi:hypothetical protein